MADGRGPALQRTEAQLSMFKDGQLAIEDQAVRQLVRCGDKIGKACLTQRPAPRLQQRRLPRAGRGEQ
ncbi:hypothetical protein [Streptomyces sp. NPDC060022]|uniref:hypothetical protein n=1 Tax=Streptomyces sp. NPDC060022 TaxID=3347039 RepID=UPI003678CAF6